MELTFTVCNPTGFTVHIADSPSNDGYAGDRGERSNDAEIHLTGTTLVAYANDFGRAVEVGDLLAVDDYVGAAGCSSRTLIVGDGYIASPTGDFARVDSTYAMRINPPTDEEGPPDGTWYVGFDRTVGGESYRDGNGWVSASICLR